MLCVFALWFRMRIFKSTTRTRSKKIKSSQDTDELSRKCPSKLTLEDLNLVKLLGTGGFGKIFLAEEKATNRVYALKSQKKAILGGPADPFMERKVLALASNSDFLVSMRSCFQTPDRIYFVLEYCIGGDLMFHTLRRRFTEDEVRFYAAEMVLAIQFLHNHHIIHRDISLQNFLLDKNGHIKLTDFGLSTEEYSMDLFRFKSCGKREYCAPELLEENCYGKAVDWWSLGVCLYFMLIRKYPFKGKDYIALAQSILNCEVSFPSGLQSETIDILVKFLCKNVLSRLGCGILGWNSERAICSHRFFKDIDWKKMENQELAPPILPKVGNNWDTRCFSRKLTDLSVKITPINENVRKLINQGFFVNFSFVNEDFAEVK